MNILCYSPRIVRRLNEGPSAVQGMYCLKLNINLIRVLIRKLHRKTRIVRWNSSDIKMDLKCDEEQRSIQPVAFVFLPRSIFRPRSVETNVTFFGR